MYIFEKGLWLACKSSWVQSPAFPAEKDQVVGDVKDLGELLPFIADSASQHSDLVPLSHPSEL